jgi:hydroxymethylbilane synthase
MSRTLRIGTRGTPLALRQAEIVIARLTQSSPNLRTDVLVIRAEGDDGARPAWTTDTPGLFTNALTRAVVANEIDAAVHSLKDLPVRVGPMTTLSAILEREDPSDVLVDRFGRTLDALPAGAVVGTCSLRRRAQLLERRPDVRIREIRGGVVHRLEALSRGDRSLSAIVLARAGLARLSRTDVITEVFPPEHWLPAPGQAAIAVEVRTTDEWAASTTTTLDHFSTRLAVTVERSVLSGLGAGCHAPVGAWARTDRTGRCAIAAAAWSLDGSAAVRIDNSALLASESDAEAFGRSVAAQLLKQGAASLLTAKVLADVRR